MISVLFLSLPCQCPLPRVFYDMWNHQHHLTTQGQDPFYLEYNTWHVCWYPAFQQWGWSTSAAPPPVLAITALWWARISVVLLFGQLSSAQSNEIPPGGWPCGWLACNPHITPWSTNPAFLQYHPTPPQTLGPAVTLRRTSNKGKHEGSATSSQLALLVYAFFLIRFCFCYCAILWGPVITASRASKTHQFPHQFISHHAHCWHTQATIKMTDDLTSVTSCLKLECCRRLLLAPLVGQPILEGTEWEGWSGQL